MAERVYVALDLETTGLSATDDAIIEIGAVRFQGDHVIDRFETLVNPRRRIPAFITQMTGISNEDVADAPALAAVAPELLAFVGSDVAAVMAHNANFDIGFLRAAGIQFHRPVYDTLELAGILAPEAGSVRFDGASLARGDAAARAEFRRRCGYLFQSNALFDSLSALENVVLPLEQTTGLPDMEIRSRGMEALRLLDLEAHCDRHPAELSGGMQKRLGIARALALRPSIIFYDDPTAGLDPITSRKIIELILRLRSEDRSTVVAVTNDMNRAFQMGDRIGMIVDGELIITGSPDETRRHEDPRVHQFIRGQLEGPLTALA